MPKPPKRQAYLISVSQERAAVQVYAVVAGTPDEALGAAALHVPPEAQVAIVGGLSRDLVKRIRLKPGELRLV